MRSVMPMPAGRVLAVDDHQVRRVALAQRGHRLAQPLPPGAADHVADEEDPHRALTLSARLSPMADSEETAAILKRALAYPYATPDRSYLYRDGEAARAAAGRSRPRRPHPAPLLRRQRRARGAGPQAGRAARRASCRCCGPSWRASTSSTPPTSLPTARCPATLQREPGNDRAGLRPPPDRRAARRSLDRDRAELRPGSRSDGDQPAYRSKHGCLAARRLAGGAGGGALERPDPARARRARDPRARPRPPRAATSALEEFVRACIARGGIRPLPRLAPL